MKYGLSWVLVGLVGLTGCDSLPWERSEPQQNRLPDRWQTYRNPRFGFEFLYPEGWVDSIPPENQDGIAFSDPRNNGLEIRSWAKLKRPDQPKQPKATPNFTTEQGISGRLEVKVEAQTSTMMLTIDQKDVEYHWRGTAPSSQFGNYYRFFSFIASRYRVPK
ncbi:hypothetical protein ACQ4M3_36615 [Leptolyngbya sp. AN03gr2]|uniref:hypothetical protein n=1 Tax=unclassified Leptolyngbya TaxID=2650499 RepID=UPI003D318C73